jgi:hypothetical protein
MFLSSDKKVVLIFIAVPGLADFNARPYPPYRAPFPTGGRKGKYGKFHIPLLPFMGEMPGGQRGREYPSYTEKMP